MRLKLEQIKQITTGATDVTEENGVFSFERFTAEQKNLYRARRQLYYDRSNTSAGIKLLFKTNSKRLFLEIKTSFTSSRTYFSVDVFKDQHCIGYIDNFCGIQMEQPYTLAELSLGNFAKEFSLGTGEKTICIHLPWSVKTSICEISVDDDSYVKSIKPEKKLLAYGDSITQGFDALRPSGRYIAKLCNKLGAEEFNKAIGGEVFFPELSACKDVFVPDYITVAYGTNDWYTLDKETFKSACAAFFANLTENYPEAKIFAITPIWRKDRDEARLFGTFDGVEKYIREIVSSYKNIVVISGYDFVPKEEKFYADLRLHPNDEGFAHYADDLYDKVREAI